MEIAFIKPIYKNHTSVSALVLQLLPQMQHLLFTAINHRLKCQARCVIHEEKPQQTPLKLKYFSLLDAEEWQDGS